MVVGSDRTGCAFSLVPAWPFAFILFRTQLARYAGSGRDILYLVLPQAADPTVRVSVSFTGLPNQMGTAAVAGSFN